MCIPKEKLLEIITDKHDYQENKIETDENNDFIRDIHHKISYDFILKEADGLKIPNEEYAEAIALVAMGHRKVALDDNDLYPPKFFVRSGRDFVCLPYLSCVLRLADELDITNIRTPKLLTKYYMPNNKKSIKEWKKHIATTQINYTEDKILFKVKCSDQNNLAALEEQFDKIQSVSNYCQKVIRTISNTGNRTFSLNVIRIEPSYNFIGFDPKGIKFSFNVQNVIKTFIGKDLYENNLTALREIIQNAVDSCRYKKSIFKEKYIPKIELRFYSDRIEVSDNGLGMDEFIIENFFGQLGSSFYEQDKVKKEFEAIGQFGVGVFSYFLLAEYIDIETKTDSGKSLKFRIDSDPKNYFHFFKKPDREITGTTITLSLKDEIKAKYNFSDYFEYIRKVFRHVEIPFDIFNNDEKYLMEAKPIEIRSKEEIEKRLKHRLKGSSSNYEIVKSKIDSDIISGECGLIIKSISKIYNFKNMYFDFNQDHNPYEDTGQDPFKITISQKGVFVSQYQSKIIGLVFGDINLKKGQKIKISRNTFDDEESINSIIDEFVSIIVQQLFKKLNQTFSIEKQAKLSGEFVNVHIQSTYYLGEDAKLFKVLKESLIFEVVDSNKKWLKLKDLFEGYDNFTFVTYSQDRIKINQNIKKTVVTVVGDQYNFIFHQIELFEQSKLFIPRIHFLQNNAYYALHKGNYEEYQSKKYKLFPLNRSFRGSQKYADFDNSLISCSLIDKKNHKDKTNVFNDDLIYNLKHPFIEFLLNNDDEILGNGFFKEIASEAFSLLHKISTSKRRFKKDIAGLNKLLKPFGTFEKLWVFSESDFQKIDE